MGSLGNALHGMKKEEIELLEHFNLNRQAHKALTECYYSAGEKKGLLASHLREISSFVGKEWYLGSLRKAWEDYKYAPSVSYSLVNIGINGKYTLDMLKKALEVFMHSEYKKKPILPLRIIFEPKDCTTPMNDNEKSALNIFSRALNVPVEYLDIELWQGAFTQCYNFCDTKKKENLHKKVIEKKKSLEPKKSSTIEEKKTSVKIEKKVDSAAQADEIAFEEEQKSATSTEESRKEEQTTAPSSENKDKESDKKNDASQNDKGNGWFSRATWIKTGVVLVAAALLVFNRKKIAHWFGW